jgi:hypothetical protein
MLHPAPADRQQRTTLCGLPLLEPVHQYWPGQAHHQHLIPVHWQCKGEPQAWQMVCACFLLSQAIANITQRINLLQLTTA